MLHRLRKYKASDLKITNKKIRCADFQMLLHTFCHLTAIVESFSCQLSCKPGVWFLYRPRYLNFKNLIVKTYRVTKSKYSWFPGWNQKYFIENCSGSLRVSINKGLILFADISSITWKLMKAENSEGYTSTKRKKIDFVIIATKLLNVAFI